MLFSVSNQTQNRSLRAGGEEKNQNIIEPFLEKEYRDSYLDGFVKGSIAIQIRALRDKFGLSQSEFAQKIGMTQSVVSRLEDTEYGSVTVNTLLKVAKENNVALDVSFVDYVRLINKDITPSAMGVDDITESYRKIEDANLSSVHKQVARANSTADALVFVVLRQSGAVNVVAQSTPIGVTSW